MSPLLVDRYIQQFPVQVQEQLQQMRQIIAANAPGATECINYGMPTFKLNGNLVHFAANKNHIGFYPAPDAIMAFKSQLADYKTSKGAIQFKLNKPLPIYLIGQITAFRVKQNLNKTK
jgi:uncharacterized protein YdhG (YjbR/CyaY superfamily)